MKTIEKIIEKTNSNDMALFYDLTAHAKKRIAQRGIDKIAINIAIEYGEEFIQKGGTFMYYITKKSLNKNKKLKRNSKILEKYIGTIVIVSENLEVITCYKNNRLKNLNKNYRKN